MRVVLLALWAAVIAFGWTRLEQPIPVASEAAVEAGCVAGRGEPAAVAQRSMPLNWLIREGDMVDAEGAPAAQTLNARYLGCPAASRDLVSRRMTWGVPHIPDEEGKLVVPVTIAPAVAGELNAGMEVEIFDSATALVRAKVAAVQCLDGCQAWLQVTPAEKQLLAASRSAPSLVIRTASIE